MEMVDLETLTRVDQDELKQHIENHKKYTHSALAEKILLDWNNSVKNFIKVFPKDYKKALERIAKENQIEQLTA